MPPLTLPIPQDLADRLAVLASETGRPVSFHFQEAVRTYLDEMEDEMEDAALAEATLARVRRGEERVYTSEEMDRLLETMHP